MYFDSRLWAFTRGVRGRIAWSMLIGLVAAFVGLARLALLGWLSPRCFKAQRGTSSYYPSPSSRSS
ncbi:MAG: hypothetical protein CM1200mP9_02160 [Gammaproteobacteria bacterium]|nr:MAG: hypothetical protein CM1200mP9_02160 [Gammaproteobacteria bacterium]